MCMLVAASSLLPVHGQFLAPYAPPATKVLGPAGLVPGLQIDVRFGQVSNTLAQLVLVMDNNIGQETCSSTRTCVTPDFDGGQFKTDSINHYVLTVSMNYSTPINQTVAWQVLSAGTLALQSFAWIYADRIILTFDITTSLNPQSSEAVAQLVDQRAASRDEAALARQNMLQCGSPDSCPTESHSLNDVYQLGVNMEMIAGIALLGVVLLGIQYVREHRGPS